MASERILLVGKVAHGVTYWHIAPLPAPVEVVEQVEEQPQPIDGELWRLICEAEETADYEEDMLDRLFWSRGQW